LNNFLQRLSIVIYTVSESYVWCEYNVYILLWATVKHQYSMGFEVHFCRPMLQGIRKYIWVSNHTKSLLSKPCIGLQYLQRIMRTTQLWVSDLWLQRSRLSDALPCCIGEIMWYSGPSDLFKLQKAVFALIFKLYYFMAYIYNVVLLILNNKWVNSV